MNAQYEYVNIPFIAIKRVCLSIKQSISWIPKEELNGSDVIELKQMDRKVTFQFQEAYATQILL